jgi:hypothetical protein
MRRFLKNRRQARRHKAEREVSLIAGITLGKGSKAELITGRTRDISETGLSLSLPIDNERQRALTAVGEASRILLVLPTKTVHVYGKIVRSLPLDSKGQLVGVHITKIDADDESIYKDYLLSLK